LPAASRANPGERYTAQSHVDLPIEQALLALRWAMATQPA
jgi:hypothetical protein